MTRTDIINALIAKNKFKSYLEIGLNDMENYNAIVCESKECVDPYIADENGCNDEGFVCRDKNGFLVPEIEKVLTYCMTSDEFFAQSKKKYDLIFIDGLHLKEQVYRDIKNSLKHLKKGGIILCHDCIPPEEGFQIVPRPCKNFGWNGDVWKVIAWLIDETELLIDVVDDDYGCGIIRDNGVKLPAKADMDYEYSAVFSSIQSRNEALHVISVNDFMEKYII